MNGFFPLIDFGLVPIMQVGCISEAGCKVFGGLVGTIYFITAIPISKLMQILDQYFLHSITRGQIAYNSPIVAWFFIEQFNARFPRYICYVPMITDKRKHLANKTPIYLIEFLRGAGLNCINLDHITGLFVFEL